MKIAKTGLMISRALVVIATALSLGAYAVSAAAQQSVPNNLFTAAGFTVKYADRSSHCLGAYLPISL
jgi:hypothetical protein